MERAIAVLNDIKDLSEMLDGARIDQARVTSSGGHLRFELELTRAMVEEAPAAHRGFFTRAKTPWVKSRLSLDQVQDVAVQPLSDRSPQQVPLLNCEAIPGGYRLVVTAPDGLQLSLTLGQLTGRFQDVSGPLTSG